MDDQNKKQQLLASFKTMQAARGRRKSSNSSNNYYSYNNGNNTISSSSSSSFNVNCRSSSGLTPLSHACRNGNYDIIQLLVDHGADVLRTDDFGFTALHHAASAGAADVVELLLDKGADVHAKSYNGSTALHCCAMMMMMCGAADDGTTTGAQHGHGLEAAHVLLDYGARLHDTNVYGKTCLQVARNGHVKAAMESYATNFASSPSQSSIMRQKVKLVICQMDELLRCTKTVRAVSNTNSSGNNNNHHFLLRTSGERSSRPVG
jgi:hypothetical protein